MIAIGRAANGKSTVLKTWAELLGTQNVSGVGLEGLSSRFQLIEMVGKQANISMDMSRLEKVEEGRLKGLVSGERMQIDVPAGPA